ncbi:MAG: hypothetical protein IKZ21_01950 [Clostridia bacterium]|nr:hypothetical protein [Clostridia bacterium]
MKTSNSHRFEYDLFRKTVPAMAFSEKTDLDTWRAAAGKKLEELLGLPLERADTPPVMEYEKEYEGYTEYRFLVETEPGYQVPCHLWIPEGVEKAPLTVCLSGHGGGMHVALGRAKNEKDENALTSWYHRAMAPRAIQEGRCALVIEARNFGESSLEGYGTSCTEAAKIAILMGRTLIGERVWDAMRILDGVAECFPRVDMTDIVVTGNSGGGTVAYYLACMDERIGAAAPSCSVCTFEASIAAMPHCLCNHIPSIRKYFEMGDLAGLIAPRKLVVAAGKEDPIFPIQGVEKAFATIQSIYRAAGAPGNCALVVGDGGHLNYADPIWQKLHEMGV